MLLLFGFGMGVLFIVLGLATFYLAPRVGPNPVFGLRTVHTMAHRDVWEDANRLTGLALMGLGVLYGLMTLLLTWLGVSTTAGIPILAVVMLLSLLGSVVGLAGYARRLSARRGIVREIAPVPFRWRYVAPSLLIIGATLVMAGWAYPQLPSLIATRFDLNGTPRSWSSPEGLLAAALGGQLLLLSIQLFLIALVTKWPWTFALEEAGWPFDRPQLLETLSGVWALVQGMIALFTADTLWYNVQGAHLFPQALLLIAAVLVVPLGILGLIVALFVRSSS